MKVTEIGTVACMKQRCVDVEGGGGGGNFRCHKA